MKYPSIETVFERDPESHKLNFGVLRFVEYGLINRWELTEKIDGTNIRVIVHGELGNKVLLVKGRTDNAQLLPALYDRIYNLTDWQEARKRALGSRNDFGQAVAFYGEGYGPKIQAAGPRYSSKFYEFICFDILIGDRLWCDFSEVRSKCKEIGIQPVPSLGEITVIPKTKEELSAIISKSHIAEDGTLEPEGVVAKPPVTILDQYGNRVMWKLCFREFDK